MSDALAFLTSQSQSCRLLSQPNCLAQLERLKDRRRSVSPKIFKFVLKCCFADWKRRELISNGQSALLAKAILADCGKASPKIPRLLRIIRQTQKCLEEKRETDDLQTQLDLMADRQMKLMGTTLVDLSHNNAENWLNDINWALIPPLWRPEAMNKLAVPLTTKPNELSRVVQLKREEKRWQTSLGVTISPRQAKLRTTVERGDLMSSTSSVSCKRTESSSSVTTISLDHLEIYKSLVDLMEPDWSDSPLGQVQTAIKQGQNSAPLDILVPAMTQISDRLVISANEIESALIYLVGEQILNTLETHKIRKSLLEAARNLDQDHIPISNFVETLRHYVICGDKAGTFQKKFLFSGHHIPF